MRQRVSGAVGAIGDLDEEKPQQEYYWGGKGHLVLHQERRSVPERRLSIEHNSNSIGIYHFSELWEVLSCKDDFFLFFLIILNWQKGFIGGKYVSKVFFCPLFFPPGPWYFFGLITGLGKLRFFAPNFWSFYVLPLSQQHAKKLGAKPFFLPLSLSSFFQTHLASY